MRKSPAIYILTLTICVSAGMVSADPPVIYANDVRNVEPGEVFNVLIYVECHTDVANYTVSVTRPEEFHYIEEGSDMVISGYKATIKYAGEGGQTLDFKFPMNASEDTSKGDYSILYEIYWNGSETGFGQELAESGSIFVSVEEVGADSPCSSTTVLILPVLAIGTAFCFIKRHGR